MARCCASCFAHMACGGSNCASPLLLPSAAGATQHSNALQSCAMAFSDPAAWVGRRNTKSPRGRQGLSYQELFAGIINPAPSWTDLQSSDESIAGGLPCSAPTARARITAYLLQHGPLPPQHMMQVQAHAACHGCLGCRHIRMWLDAGCGQLARLRQAAKIVLISLQGMRTRFSSGSSSSRTMLLSKV